MTEGVSVGMEGSNIGIMLVTAIILKNYGGLGI